MKLYYKYINEQQILYKDPLIIDGMLVFNPSEEQILSDGWLESDELQRTLDDVKQQKIQEIIEYDSSYEVNGFSVNNDLAWIDALTRAMYKASIESAELLEEETITFAINDIPITLPILDAKIMLAKIQRYADNCYMVTLQHKANVNALENKEDVEAYDYTVGYPEKLTFNVQN